MRSFKEIAIRGVSAVLVAGSMSGCDGGKNNFQPPVSDSKTSIETSAFPEAVAEEDVDLFRGLIEDFFQVENNPRLSAIIYDPSLSNGFLLKVRTFEYDQQTLTKTAVRGKGTTYSLDLPGSSGLKHNVVSADVYPDLDQKINRVIIRYNLAELAPGAEVKDRYTNDELRQMAGLVIKSSDKWIDNQGHIHGKRVKEDGLSAFERKKGQYTEHQLLANGSGLIKRYY